MQTIWGPLIKLYFTTNLLPNAKSRNATDKLQCSESKRVFSNANNVLKFIFENESTKFQNSKEVQKGFHLLVGVDHMMLMNGGMFERGDK